jgi:hypothetical protein
MRAHLNEKKLGVWHVPVIPVTVGVVNRENCGPDWPGQKARPCLQNNQGKKGWRCGSSGKVPAKQAQSPDFKLQNCQNNTPHTPQKTLTVDLREV